MSSNPTLSKTLQNPPWATTAGALEGFVQILNKAWFSLEGDDDLGDEFGLKMLERTPLPSDEELAKRVRKLWEDFAIFVTNYHAHPKHPEWNGRYFVSEAEEIVSLLSPQ